MRDSLQIGINQNFIYLIKTLIGETYGKKNNKTGFRI